jgi:uncharacterized protein YjbI with pentapeptide repeats
VSCCKTDRFGKSYGWCKTLNTVYGDEKGLEYCVFHAPQGKKGVSHKEFNHRVFRRIEEAKGNRGEASSQPSICDLSGTVFEGDFRVEGILPAIILAGAQFTGDARFEGTQFKGIAVFKLAHFQGDANFGEARFGGDANFELAQFQGDANFGEARFGGDANFNGANFGKAGVGKTEVERVATFRRVQFSGETTFFQTKFNQRTNFLNVRVRKHPLFEEAELANVCFMDTDVRKVNFVNCRWHNRNGRRVVNDETEFSRKPFGALWNPAKDRVNAIQKIETVYRRLKQRCKEDHNEREASIWHYSEKEMQRKASCLRHFFEFLLLHLYYLSSGYGERPLRAFGVLVGLIGAACAGLALQGLKGVDPNPFKIDPYQLFDVASSDGVKAAIVNVFKYLTFQRDPYLTPATQGGECVKLAAQVFIPMQAALFALALRNRFRR